MMASWAGKGIIAFRMLHKEIFGVSGDDPEPTTLDLYATAVMDGAGMERVSRKCGTSGDASAVGGRPRVAPQEDRH